MQRGTVLKWTIAFAVAFMAGMAANHYWSSARHLPAATDAGLAAGIKPIQAKTSYVCPMHSHVVSDKPGTCPICGMALVAVKPAAAKAMTSGDAQPAVEVEPEVINSLGVKLARVRRATLARRIEAPGFVQQIDAGPRARVQAPFAAKVAALYVKPGQWLEQGRPLLTLQSDTLLAAEQAHVALLKADPLPEIKSDGMVSGAAVRPGTEPVTLEQSRQGLARLGLSDDAIRQLEEARTPSARLTLRAPYPGQVTNVRVFAGASVDSGAMLFELSGLARASMLANAFQRDAAWIQSGQPVEVRLPHVSGQAWSGLVNQAAVSIDPSSQNIGVQISFDAPAHLLRNAMYVVATLHGDAHRGVLAVPQEALIRTEAEDRVIVALGQGRFKPVRVRIGIETGDQVEILSGLKEGQEIVVSAQFLIDSESSLQASLRRMEAHY